MQKALHNWNANLSKRDQYCCPRLQIDTSPICDCRRPLAEGPHDRFSHSVRGVLRIFAVDHRRFGNSAKLIAHILERTSAVHGRTRYDQTGSDGAVGRRSPAPYHARRRGIYHRQSLSYLSLHSSSWHSASRTDNLQSLSGQPANLSFNLAAFSVAVLHWPGLRRQMKRCLPQQGPRSPCACQEPPSPTAREQPVP